MVIPDQNRYLFNLRYLKKTIKATTDAEQAEHKGNLCEEVVWSLEGSKRYSKHCVFCLTSCIKQTLLKPFTGVRCGYIILIPRSIRTRSKKDIFLYRRIEAVCSGLEQSCVSLVELLTTNSKTSFETLLCKVTVVCWFMPETEYECIIDRWTTLVC